MQLCSNCQLTPPYVRELCSACYQYQYIHNSPRPRKLWHKPQQRGLHPPPTACVNCGRSKVKLQDKRCHACYQYRRRHGAERPKRYWSTQPQPPPKPPPQPPHKRCDCGQPATHRTPIRFGTATGYSYVTEIDLCDECHRFEMEMQEEFTARGLEIAA